MTGMTIADAVKACGGTYKGSGDESRELGRVVIDSRAVQPGDLFVAYKGEKVDGHDYISAALDKGAACCLCEHVPQGENRGVIVADDVQLALEAIAAAYRDTLTLPIIGITGSVGKTSAKEMISAVLSSRMNVLKTDRNLNNQIGVPMTLSRITPQHDAAVIEMGISGFGEMRRLGKMVRPQIAVYTLIGHAHLEFLHDLDGVLRAKTEMLDEMPDNACVIMNGDDEKLKAFSCRQRKITFGFGADCDVRAENVELREEHTLCDIVFAGRRFSVQIPAFGKHLVYAALEGAAVGLEMGLTDEEIARGISSFETVGRRSAVIHTGKLTLLDDCYNSNAEALHSGIDSLLELPGRPVCILGDMLELGQSAAEIHRAGGAYAREKGVRRLLCCGSYADAYCEGAGSIARKFPDRESLIAALGEEIRPDDCVLVKASRGAHFEEISEALKVL